MAGLRINTPWLLNWFGSGAGDYFSVMGTYTQGALRYLFQNPNSNWWLQDGHEYLPTPSCLMASMGASALTGLPPASS